MCMLHVPMFRGGPPIDFAVKKSKIKVKRWIYEFIDKVVSARLLYCILTYNVIHDPLILGFKGLGQKIVMGSIDKVVYTQ